ncbi:uncharacterized protein [Apostichopus japonicus]|uniref:uncharacterized protein isoform X3 n=1 Tax=Stichopus japonicus TaxID=307972 RepID=UPI003AB18350
MILNVHFLVLLLGLCASQETEQPFLTTLEFTTDILQGSETISDSGAVPREDSGVGQVFAVPISSTQIQVEWAVVPANTLSDVQYYHINYVKIGGQRERDDRVFDTSVLLFQLRPFSVYEITVTAEGNSGSYEYALATAQTFEDVPSAPPKDVTLTAVSSTAIAVTWNPPQPNRQNGIITSYSLRYREVGSTFPQIVSTIADETSIILSGLSRDTSYEVRLAAATVNGTGPYTPWRQRKTLDEEPEPQPPAVPSSLSVNSSITYAIITWAEPSEEEEADFEGYILSYGSTIPDEFDVTIEPTETFYNLTGLTPDTEYIVYLRSFNGLTDSVPISVFFRTQSKPIDDPMLPKAPLTLQLTASSSYIVASWTMPEGSGDVTGFSLYYGIEIPEEEYLLIDAGESFYNVTNLIADTTYTFSLAAVNDIGESEPILASTSTLPRPIELAIPSAPSSLSLSPSVTTVLVSWEMQEMESLDLDGFILSYGVISSEENLMLIDPDRTSIEIKKLRPSTTYKFKLVSYNDIGDSVPVTGTATTLTELVELLPPLTPSSLVVEPSITSVMVSWTPPAAESTAVTGYRISYGDRYAQQLPAEQTSHELRDLEPSTEYTFELRSFNDAGESDPILETVTTLEQETLVEASASCDVDNGGCSHDCVSLDDGSYACRCPEGYRLDSSLKNCEDINECIEDTQTCSAPSVECVNYPGTFACDCSPGHHIYNEVSRFCEDINECNENPLVCGSTAVCVNTFGGYECPCKTGFVYPDNEENSSGNCIDVDECQVEALIPLLCGHHASCRNTEGAFECDCLPGYIKGSGFCDDLNECAEGNPCGFNGFCENLEGSFNCSCGIGYISKDGQCEDIDECALDGDDQVCPDTMACVNHEGSYHCYCPPGFTSNGSYCEDINECSTPNHQCSENSFCGNLLGSYYCQCIMGYVGNGKDCYDVDECESSNGGCPHHCTNTEGSYHCSCAEGFEQSETDQEECQDINECADESLCDQHCNNTIGSYKCSCDKGYTLHSNGRLCVDIDECMMRNDCQEVCINIPGGYKCDCSDLRTLIPDNKTHCKDVTNCREKNGGCDQICREDQRGLLCSCQYGSVLDGDGHTCNDVNECLESNGGCEQLCVNTPGSFTCQCRRGYRPRDDSPYQCVSECVPPCLNYGVCVGPNTCVCPTGYGGQTCTPTCNPPCAHGGSCRRFNMCQCPVGYTGPACQKATCVLPCMNGGLCIGPNRCQCPARYTGDRCETSKCVPECRNGGSCYASNTCLCPEGFYGPRCQNERSLCSPGYCKNDGVCVGVNKCRCSAQFTGLRCANRIPRRCVPPCRNGGTCLANNRCSCPKGVAGVRCQKRTCAVESFQTTHIEFRNRYVSELYSGACGPFGFRICNQYRLVPKRVSEIVYRAAYRSTC